MTLRAERKSMFLPWQILAIFACVTGQCNCSDLVAVADDNVARSLLPQFVVHLFFSLLSVSFACSRALSLSCWCCPFLLCVIIDFALHFSSTFSALHTQRVISLGFFFGVASCYLVLFLSCPLFRLFNILCGTVRVCVCVCVFLWNLAKITFLVGVFVSFRFVRHESDGGAAKG